MGKLTPAQPAAGSSSQSVHSLQLLDHDDTDLLVDDDNYEDPPSYDAAINENGPISGSSSNSRTRAGVSVPSARLIDADYRLIGGRRAQSVRSSVRNTHIVTLQPEYTLYAEELAALMAQQVRLPPRPQVIIHGSHTETSTNNKDNKKQSNAVTDFNFRLDLAETLLTGWESLPTTATRDVLPQSTWFRASVSMDYDERKTYRGTRRKTLVWKGPKGGLVAPSSATLDRDASYRDEEEGLPPADAEQERLIQGDKSGLLEWCQRYCNDPSPVKSFTLTRHVHNFKEGSMADYLKSQIRETNYRGQITAEMEIVNGKVTIYSPHWVNKLRNNWMVFWACIILQLWIITWPIIWLLEKKYAVVYSCWYSSHTVDEGTGAIARRIYARGRDEHTLAEFWAPAVKQAAWGRRKDNEILLLQDAERLQGLTTEQVLRARTTESDAELERRRRVDRGDGTFVDSVIGLARGVSEVRQDWNMTMGWGGNT
ncbi:uncharacterized protein BHQ10_010282 [Talaromyces amestolkiae]|uniref:Uncharacterized protein n=1 Tax=Talaromyces amestolkiae TaxID=1196081 RepID=A0A364LEM3_TALAM|nr:uncharacterized protein BHQ10_010282 [Talaromyces amestolkiae]RAO74270.1 hypothetical protein BHQ10_010282 [Talaromyces amestolkiae]